MSIGNISISVDSGFLYPGKGKFYLGFVDGQMYTKKKTNQCTIYFSQCDFYMAEIQLIFGATHALVDDLNVDSLSAIADVKPLAAGAIIRPPLAKHGSVSGDTVLIGVGDGKGVASAIEECGMGT
jgi:hypothetical protein